MEILNRRRLVFPYCFVGTSFILVLRAFCLFLYIFLRLDLHSFRYMPRYRGAYNCCDDEDCMSSGRSCMCPICYLSLTSNKFAPQVGDVDNNLNRADAVLSKANPHDLDILVLPELAFSGRSYLQEHRSSPAFPAQSSVRNPDIQQAITLSRSSIFHPISNLRLLASPPYGQERQP